MNVDAINNRIMVAKAERLIYDDEPSMWIITDGKDEIFNQPFKQ